MMPPRMSFPTILLLLAVLAAPSARAQFAVGTADVTYSDPARGNRAVPVDLYYPALAAGADQPVAAPPPAGFPVVSFGHGFQMTAGVYAWVAGKLAGLGCVVAVPRTGGELFPSHEQFALDLAFVARTLRAAGGDLASPFHGRMGSRTLVMGHSMGGGCSFLAAGGDPSITAVANFAAAETDPSAVAACAGLAIPALVFAGTNDCVTPPAGHQIPMYEALGGWRARVTITGASHCQFNAYSFLCDVGESCSADIDRQQQQDAVWQLLEPWVRWVLLQEPGAGARFEAVLAAGGGFTAVRDGGVAATGHDVPHPTLWLTASPNPFNPAVGLNSELAVAGPARLEIFDVRGQRVRVLVDGALAAGPYRWRWDGRDDDGRAVPGGSYLARLRSSGGSASAKLLLLR